MPLYETVFLVRQDVSGQAVDDLVEAYKTVITENGGSVGRTENWGLKTLAYRIEKNRKAHFALMDIDAPSPAVEEMERQMRLNEDVLRTLTIKVEAHEDGPSVMKQKRDRDDRRRRERGGRDDDDGGFEVRGDRGDRDRGDRPERSDRPRREFA
jgi:small subunit ribosomal protein S6